MATTSFEQRFVVSEEKRTEFLNVINAPHKRQEGTFKSRYLTGDDLQKYVKRVTDKK